MECHYRERVVDADKMSLLTANPVAQAHGSIQYIKMVMILKLSTNTKISALLTLSFPPYDFRFLLLTRNNQSELCFYPRSFVGCHCFRRPKVCDGGRFISPEERASALLSCRVSARALCEILRFALNLQVAGRRERQWHETFWTTAILLPKKKKVVIPTTNLPTLKI